MCAFDLAQRPCRLLAHPRVTVFGRGCEHGHRVVVLDLSERPYRDQANLNGLIVQRRTQRSNGAGSDPAAGVSVTPSHISGIT